MYLQSIHLTRLVSRLITVKSLQSEWRITELFSAECGASLNSSRVATAKLNVYPYIIPGSSRLPSIALTSHCRLSHEVAQVGTSKWLIIRRPIYCVKNTTSNIICRVRLSYLTIASVFVGSIHSPHLLFSCRQGNTVPLHFVKFEKNRFLNWIP